jgi:muramoyltetrapeptide carboxypeptidase LdcA involved in peptidoglycan recycling
MNATLAAAAAALTDAGFAWTLDPHTHAALRVECVTISDRVFDLYAAVKDMGVRIAPWGGGWDHITSVTTI